MSQETVLHFIHSSHLDLYWAGTQSECLEQGAAILKQVVETARSDKDFYFLIDTVRFLEYYLDKYPGDQQTVKELFEGGQLEIGGCYTDRLEHHHDGESLVRNILYGQKVLNRLIGYQTNTAVHPDLPSLAEQTPQIYQKSDMRYYVFARGFKYGAQFYWKGLDRSKIIAFNFPAHYSFYSIEDEVIANLEEIKQTFGKTPLCISISPGDLGPINHIRHRINKEDALTIVSDLQEHLQQLKQDHPHLYFKRTNLRSILEKIDLSKLRDECGESPSKWGTYGSATNVELFQLDKQVSAELQEAEKYSTVCDALQIPIHLELNNPLHKHYRWTYYDRNQNPSSISEWIEFAWRLQMVTHDHNYGGVGGPQSNHDRFVYKEAAFQIAQTIKSQSLDKIMACLRYHDNSIVVFNSMNWRRSETVEFQIPDLDKSKQYFAVDMDHRRFPLIQTNRGYAMHVSDVPSFGYKQLRIEEGSLQSIPVRQVIESEHTISLKNMFYALVIDKQKGTLSYVKDLELDQVLIEKDSLFIEAYSDQSRDIPEIEHLVEFLDRSSNHTRDVSIVEDNYLWSKVLIVSEICDSKVTIEIVLNHVQKELIVKPKIYWTGKKHVKLTLDFNFMKGFQNTHYGVPYGVQSKGHYLAGEDSPFRIDEISKELYSRYREIQGFFVLENAEKGISVCTNLSSWDLNGNDVKAVLLRNVKSCGDIGLVLPNNGELTWQINLSSYEGNWESNSIYKAGWAFQYPLTIKQGVNGASKILNLPGEASFIDTDESGIITVFKKSTSEENKYILRLFNSTSSSEALSLKSLLNIQPLEVCDLKEQRRDDPLDVLESFEIKTIKCSK